MLCHAYAPSAAPAPLLYAQYTWVKELGVRWDEIRLEGLDPEDISHLAEMLGILREAQALKQRVAGG